GVGPEHSYLKDQKRVKYVYATDKEVIDAFLMLTRSEGIIPALESSHAIAEAIKLAKKKPKSESIVVTLSGRGDKDVEVVQEYVKNSK
ncbi:MAG TPA: tryptophan synthase subunit beta, partial [Candidatus Nitrosotenuis sp.]|nr:tryptophan synthase subunit beta [Candidatus Nitrosotenuis sp.]